MISRVVFLSSPIPRRSSSLRLQREALETVVPSSRTGYNGGNKKDNRCQDASRGRQLIYHGSRKDVRLHQSVYLHQILLCSRRMHAVQIPGNLRRTGTKMKR